MLPARAWSAPGGRPLRPGRAAAPYNESIYWVDVVLKHEWIVYNSSIAAVADSRSALRHLLNGAYSTLRRHGGPSFFFSKMATSAGHHPHMTLMWFAFACGKCLRSRSLVETTTTTRSRIFVSSQSLTSISRGPPLRQGGCSDLQQLFRVHQGSGWRRGLGNTGKIYRFL